MSLEFELWPGGAVQRFSEEVSAAAGSDRMLAADTAQTIRMRISAEFPEWAEATCAALLDHVLTNVGVVEAPAAELLAGERRDAERARPATAPGKRSAPAKRTARRTQPASRVSRWRKEIVISHAQRIAASSSGDGPQMIVAIQAPDGGGRSTIRRTVWRPQGAVGFWYEIGSPPATEWREKSAGALEAEDAWRRTRSPMAPYPRVVEIPHALTSLGAISRTGHERAVIVGTPAGECFVSRWVRGEWYPRFSRLTPLDSIVDIAASSAGAEHEEIFAVTARGSVHSTYSIAGGEWTRWTHFPSPEGPGVIGVATASRCAGQQELVVLDYDGRLFHRWRVADSGWQPEGWSELGLVPGARRIAASGSPGGLIVFVATAVSLHLRRYSTHLQGWEEWATIGALPSGGDVADVAVVRDPDDSSATLIVLMQDGSLHRLATGYTNPR